MNQNRAFSAVAALAGITVGLLLASPWSRPSLSASRRPARDDPTGAYDAYSVARLIADETDIDFGVVPEGEVVSHAFVLRNVSNQPLSIVNVQASCSCTVADVDVDTLAPGQSTELYATIDLADYVGVFERTIIVEIDDRNAKSLELSMSGTVEPDEQ